MDEKDLDRLVKKYRAATQAIQARKTQQADWDKSKSPTVEDPRNEIERLRSDLTTLSEHIKVGEVWIFAILVVLAVSLLLVLFGLE